MKYNLILAMLASFFLTSSNCHAALEYTFDKETKLFTVKSEDIISLDNGTNELRVAFLKKYELTPTKRGNMPKKVSPNMSIYMTARGAKDYRFADNVNYWQDHNYSYTEMEAKHQYDTDKKALDAKKQALKSEKTETKHPSNEDKAIWEQRKEKINLLEKELKMREQAVIKDPKKLNRNPSTLIYLQVDNKLDGTNISKPLYEFGVGSDKMPTILVEKEIQDQAQQRERMVEQVRATRKAFYEYQQEQKNAMKGLLYTSIAFAELSSGDNFFKKVVNSSKTRMPLFLEVKFWNGGPNQVIWLKEAKINDLNELLNYDLYKDSTHLEQIKNSYSIF